MAAANEPQTDRELILQMNAELKGAINRLSDSIEHFGNILNKQETEKIQPLIRKVEELEAWKQRVDGVYKALVIFSTIATVCLTLITIYDKLKK